MCTKNWGDKHCSHAHLHLFTSEIHLLSTGAIPPCKDLVVHCGEKEEDDVNITRVDSNG